MEHQHSTPSDLESSHGSAERGFTAMDSSSTRNDSQHGQSVASSNGLGTKESLLVNRSKRMVYLALLLVTAAVCTLAYVLLSNEEESAMVAEFESFSRVVLNQAQGNSVDMFVELWDLSKGITAHALGVGATWPNVTFPHLYSRVYKEHPNRASLLEFVVFAPFLTPENRDGWVAYAHENAGWIAEDYAEHGWTEPPIELWESIHPYQNDTWEEVDQYNETRFHYEVPVWQIAPPPKDPHTIMMDLATEPIFGHILWDVKLKNFEQHGRTSDLHCLLPSEINDDHPRGTIYQPIFADFTEEADIVGFMMASLTWDKIFQNIALKDAPPMMVEIEGTCNSRFVYEIHDGLVDFLAYGDESIAHLERFAKYSKYATLLEMHDGPPGEPPIGPHEHRHTDASHPDSHCEYRMWTYPTQEFVEDYQTNKPIYYTLVVLTIFIFTLSVFVSYDFLVQRRQEKLMKTATQSNAIVSSLFPKAVQERMMEELEEQKDEKKGKGGKALFMGSKREEMADFCNSGACTTLVDEKEKHGPNGKPIADFFPDATIMFADIVGFTAWSNTREPTAVFRLLETLYGSFDVIAKRRRVFKVETIGDCYVAVCGLPDPRKDHAVVMVRFARDCLVEMQKRLTMLESALGPDTATLGMRFGLHTGPVTAGVLRGERARFQLFGDSVNTAARIEASSQKNRIHMSHQTAEVITAAGKGHWIEERKDQIKAKGLGKLQTFWVKGGGEESVTSGERDGLMQSEEDPTEQKEALPGAESKNCKSDAALFDQTHERLIDYISNVLSSQLATILAKRRDLHEPAPSPDELAKIKLAEEMSFSQTRNPIEEVVDVIQFPEASEYCVNEDDVQPLNSEMRAVVKSFVEQVATMYQDNAFHSFNHACHVMQSTIMLLSRISKSDSHGIAADPLVVFATSLSALIHDVDHSGIPNFLIRNSNPDLASMYRQRSIAEQNSIDIAWGLFMEPEFAKLRSAIYNSMEEFETFRHIIVNAVIATDIFDPELGELRTKRWNCAFGDQQNDERGEGAGDACLRNRKATILMEHILQASDVSHMMQHWEVYTKWNGRFYQEMYTAYKMGHMDRDPTEDWYNSELCFFDNYIIPLAQRLRDSRLFGVSSNELLHYAESNREEWKMKGERLVAANHEAVKSLKFPSGKHAS